MAIRTILTEEDPVLHKKCHPDTRFDAKLGRLMDDLKETLAHANGAGLAAPQVGILRRAVVVVDAEDQMLELINPEIIWTEGEQDGLEGCLSVPGRWGMVKRPMKARVRAQDRTGAWFEAEGHDVTARCFCHEISHLDGHLYTELCDKLYTNEELDRMLEEQEQKTAQEGRR